MAGLIQLVFAEDNETLIRKDNGQKVDAKPNGGPIIGWAGEGSSIQDWLEEREDWLVKGSNAYVKGEGTGVRFSGGYSYMYYPFQFYRIDTNE